ncbi:MAG: hypothetical protein JJT95_17495, partial [Pararhodobacter sp.]|nr:hypothetical protein [Pararhodobacter sp.]
AESQAGEPPDATRALRRLAALLPGDGSRHDARARLLWRLGRADEARASLADITPGSPGAAPALSCRADLSMRAGDLVAARADLETLRPLMPPGRWQALSMRLIRLEAGGAALRRAVGHTDLPACPELWHTLLSLFITERDFPAARRALARLRAVAGDAHAQTRRAEIVLALEAEDSARARALLAADTPPEDAAAPWRWPPRRHALALRAGLLEAGERARPEPALAALAGQASAAARIHASDQGLAALALNCRLAAGDWAALEEELAHKPSGAAAHVLLRMGLPGPARAALPAATTAPARLRHALALARVARAEGSAPAAVALLAPLDAPTAPLAAELALERAEAAQAAGDPQAARALLAVPVQRFPRRPPLWLALSRAAFQQGDFAAAARAQRRLRALKSSQTGAPPPPDLRDMLTDDALRAARSLPEGALHGPPGAIAESLAASPGLAAFALGRAMRQGALPALAAGGALPGRLVHYWEGPESAPVARNLAAWAALHPGWAQRVFGPDEALQWLAARDGALARLFAAISLPAARADLFRLAWLAHEGGIWADTDEFPRAPVEGWLKGAGGVFVIEPGFGSVANNFIAARPGLAVVERALALAVEGLEARLAAGAAPYPWWDSGPAVMTRALAGAVFGGAATGGAADGLRLVGPMDYAARVSTNLPLPHKRGALHWR